MFLKQSTTVTIRMGPALDATDGVTEETALSPTVEVSKNHGAFAARNSATAITHDSNGWYAVELNATDTNTVGKMIAKFDDAATHLPVWHEFWVIEEAIFDALFGASAGGFDANGRVDVGSWLGTAVTVSATSALPEVDAKSISDDATAANNAEAFFDDTGFAASNSTIGTCTTNTDMRGTDNAALASVVGALADAAAAGDPTTADTLMQYIKQLVNVLVGSTGVTTFPSSAAPANNVSLAEIIRSIYDDTNSLDGTKVPDTISLANINSEVDTALTDIGLDHLVSASVVGTDVTDNSIVARLVSKSATADWDDFVNTTDSLQALRDHVGDGTNLTEAGGTGDHLTAIFTTQMTESYNADGTAPTPAQALFGIFQILTEMNISGTTATIKKLDGSATAMVLTLDDSSNPTTITRAS